MTLKKYRKEIAAIGTAIVLSMLCLVYILSQQRVSSPIAEKYTVKAVFDQVNAVQPGVGEPVTVAGVKVGQIVEPELENGRGVLYLQIQTGKLPHVYTNAKATLLPNTPVKDMQVDLQPGGHGAKPLPDGGKIPVTQTTTPTDADELLLALDSDTRTWMRELITNVDLAGHGRAHDLNALLQALGPTTRQVRDIGDLLAQRRHRIARLVHNLARLSRAVDEKDPEVTRVIDAGNATLAALASQDGALRTSIHDLPGTLHLARSVLGHTRPFARELTPTLRSLEPTVRALPRTLRLARRTFRGTSLVGLNSVVPFAEAAQPLARRLPPLARDLTASTPVLTSSFTVLRYITNELAFNPGGRNRGFLYWFAWFAHNTNSVLSTEDANGAVFRGLPLVSCSTVTDAGQFGQLVGLLAGVSSLCPASGGG